MCALLLNQSILNAQSFRVRSDGAIQIGYGAYKYLTFGNCNYATPNNGEWAIEYWDDNNGTNKGLNFWKPYPSTNDGNYKLFLKNNGNIGVGTGSPSFKLTVHGTIASYGTIVISSDRRLKSEVRPLQSTMDKLSQLNGVAYRKYLPDLHINEIDTQGITDEAKLNTIRDDQSNREELEQNENYGFIAQELREVFPELVREDNDGYLGIDYISLIPVMVEAMKELREEIDILKSANWELEIREKSTLENNNSTGNTIQEATLYQNAPNPFSSETEIKYYVPNNTGQASLLIFDMQGGLKKQMQVSAKGNGSVTINASELPAGMYIYSLIVDGREIDSKRMILTK